MAKVQLKSDNINPYERLFSIFRQFDRNGLHSAIDHLGKKGSMKSAFSMVTSSPQYLAAFCVTATSSRTV